MSWWDKVTLGRSGLSVSRLGLGSSYGIAGRDVERAIERGINYLYWGSRRRDDFGRAIAHAARRSRESLCVVVQSYSRSALTLGPSLDLALRRLKLEYADVLLLGWWNSPPPERILDKALELRESGRCRALMVSCHHRPTFESYIADPIYDAIMVRYNAAHRGAEREVFPHLADNPPGVVAYTATRWGTLLDRAWVPTEELMPRASDLYRFALSNPAVNTVISGPATASELDEAMHALDRGPLSPDELAWLHRVGDAVHAHNPVTSSVWSRVTRTVRSALSNVASR